MKKISENTAKLLSRFLSGIARVMIHAKALFSAHNWETDMALRTTRNPDFRRAASEAKKLLKKHSLSAPPIDPEEIAELEGIKVVYAEFEAPDNEDVSGFFSLEKKTIFVNKEISENRITFTIAHELAHYAMHQEYIKSNNYIPMPRNNEYPDGKPPEEIEADSFAANLLVPLSMLKRYKGVASVSELARLFFVSEDVIRNRLDLLKRYPSLALG